MNNEKSKMLVKKKESDMRMGDQSKKLEFVNQSIEKFKHDMQEKDQLISQQRSELIAM